LRKNPEARYLPAADNRASFIKSQTYLTTELGDLGFAARGAGEGNYKESFDRVRTSHSPDDIQREKDSHALAYVDSTRSPIGSSIESPFIPGHPHSGSSSPNFHAPSHVAGSRTTSPRVSVDSRRTAPVNRTASPFQAQDRPVTSNNNQAALRGQNSNSPWQRGAGYDH